MTGRNYFPQVVVLFFVVACVFLNMGTIRRKDDPILKTQTDPILYKQKKEEIKDGYKGAPTPYWRLYPKYDFLVEPPYEKTQAGDQSQEDALPAPWDTIPEDFEGWDSSEAKQGADYWEPAGDDDGGGDDSWWEDARDEEKQEESGDLPENNSFK